MNGYGGGYDDGYGNQYGYGNNGGAYAADYGYYGNTMSYVQPDYRPGAFRDGRRRGDRLFARVPERGHDHELLRAVPPEVAGHDAAVGDAVECGDDWQQAARVGEKELQRRVLRRGVSALRSARAVEPHRDRAARKPIAVADEVEGGERRGRRRKLPLADDDTTAQRAESCRGALVPLQPDE